MNYKKITMFILTLILFAASACFSAVPQKSDILAEIIRLDPETVSELNNEDMLYALVRYESDTPLRFQAIAARAETALEVGAIRNPASLHAPGRGEALVWVNYTNPTHIDAISVVIMDENWQELYRLNKAADMTWSGVAGEIKREPADWVKTLTKSERRKLDFVYDPAPKKFGTLYDIIFFLTIASIPAYLLLQLHMLWRYKYRWRELAIIPLFPFVIVAFYALVGLDIERSLEVTFLFRYTPLALLYLVALWLAKRFWQNKLPPPKLYKPPKS